MSCGSMGDFWWRCDRRKGAGGGEERHPLLQTTFALGLDGVTLHECLFHAELMALYKDYAIGGRVLFPGAGFIEFALAAAWRKGRRSDSGQRMSLSNVELLRPCEVATGSVLVCEVGDTRIDFRALRGDVEAGNVFCRVGRWETSGGGGRVLFPGAGFIEFALSAAWRKGRRSDSGQRMSLSNESSCVPVRWRQGRCLCAKCGTRELISER